MSRKQAKAAPETVYALYNFRPKNADELAFQAGDSIIVLDKCDNFNDGWWEVSRTRRTTSLLVPWLFGALRASL